MRKLLIKNDWITEENLPMPYQFLKLGPQVDEIFVETDGIDLEECVRKTCKLKLDNKREE